MNSPLTAPNLSNIICRHSVNTRIALSESEKNVERDKEKEESTFPSHATGPIGGAYFTSLELS